MIWHIFKKDFRLLWHFAAGVAALEWLGVILTIQAEHGGIDGQPISAFLNFVLVTQLIASGLLAAAAVQLDAIPGVRQDWLIRPIVRRDLLLAKLLFVVVMVQGPVLIADVVHTLTVGVPPGTAILAVITRDIWMLGAYYLPVMALASITRSVTENILAIVIALTCYSFFATVTNSLTPFRWKMLGSTGVDWLSEGALLLVATLGAVAIVSYQFFKRRTLSARWLTAGFGLLCLIVTSLPWGPAFAIQQRLSPHPGGASAVNMEFQPTLGRRSRMSPTSYSFAYREKGTSVYLPIRVSGLAPDTILRADMVQTRLIAADGKVETLAPVVPPPDRNEGANAPSERSHYELLFMPAALYASLQDKPVRLELDYSLTLLHLSQSNAMPALGSWQTIPGFGRCETRLDKSGLDVQLHCLMNPSTPPCATFFLENPATGSRNPAEVACHGQYTPLYIQYDAVRGAMIDLPFRDAAGLARYPVDGQQLRESRVVMRFYQPVEHFTRHLTVTDVRLGEWMPN